MAGFIGPLLGAIFGGRNSGDQGADPIKMQEAFQKKLAMDNAITNMNKLQGDSDAAKAAGSMDSANKQINAMTTAGKALQF